MGDYSHLKNKKGELIAQPLPQPTLPNLSVDDDDSSSMKTRVAAPSTYTQDSSYYYKGDKGVNPDYPPMPAYNPYLNHQVPGSFAQYNPSAAALSHDDSAYPSPHPYDDDNESTVNLASAAAPFARDPIDRHGSPYGPPQAGNYDAHNVYQGRIGSVPPQQHRRSPPTSVGATAPQSLDDPYGGYTSSPAPVSNHSSRGRSYDEEIGYGRGQGGQHAM